MTAAARGGLIALLAWEKSSGSVSARLDLSQKGGLPFPSETTAVSATALGSLFCGWIGLVYLIGQFSTERSAPHTCASRRDRVSCARYPRTRALWCAFLLASPIQLRATYRRGRSEAPLAKPTFTESIVSGTFRALHQQLLSAKKTRATSASSPQPCHILR